MNPRLRRLNSDYEALSAAFAGHPNIAVQPMGPLPPEKYRITYSVPGLTLTPDRRPVRTRQTVVDVFLPAGYPREKPYLTSLGPVFHPNFGSHVCIADFWSPSQSLVDIVVQVGDMLQWRTYNVRSPLNAVAANWALDNQHQLPVGNSDVAPLPSSDVLLGRAESIEEQKEALA